MIRVFKPPHFIPGNWNGQTYQRIFLAGSIEMGAAEDWQTLAAKYLEEHHNKYPHVTTAVLNPRRDDWDSSWSQDVESEPFNDQVTWELDALDSADGILFYFDPKTTSPISLGELYHYGPKDALLVVCPAGYVKKGNVDHWCKRHRLTQVDTLRYGTQELLRKLREC